jgi:hypothetical protein
VWLWLACVSRIMVATVVCVGWNESNHLRLQIPLLMAPVRQLSVNHCSILAVATDNTLHCVFNEHLNCFYRSFLLKYLEDQREVNRTCKGVRLVDCNDNCLFDCCTTLEEGGSSCIHISSFLFETIRTITLPCIVSMLACGEQHCLLLSTSGKVFVQGSGEHGVLGLGLDVTKSDSFEYLHTVSEHLIMSVAAGNHHSCLLTSQGELLTCGSKAYGRLGLPNDSQPDEYVSIADSTIGVFTPQLVESLLGVGELLPTGVTRGLSLVSCGQWHTIAVAAGCNDVYGWGWNKFGQFGDQHFQEIVVLPERITILDDENLLGESFTSDKAVTKVLCGSTFTSLFTASGQMIVM